MITVRKFVYEQIRDELIDMINRNRLKVGDRLPSERQLARQFDSNYHTIRKALKLLHEQQIIEKRPARGSFVQRIPRYMPRVQGGFKLLLETHNGIGVICQKKYGNFNNELTVHLRAEAKKHDCFLIVNEVEEFDENVLAMSRQLLYQGCFAVILMPSREKSTDRQIVEIVEKSALPIILLSYYLGAEHAVIFKEKKPIGFCESTILLQSEYLMQLGYRHIAFFGPDVYDEIANRIYALSQFASRNNLSPLFGLVKDDHREVDRIVEYWSEFAGDLGVMCYDDEHAIRLINALHKHNLRVPADVGVIGTNNSSICQLSDPPLTTIQFPYQYLADAAVTYAMSLKTGNPEKLDDTSKTALVIRDSCGGKLRIGKQLPELVDGLYRKYDSFCVSVSPQNTKRSKTI